ncbi:MAG: hypothetical protein ACK5KV_00430 [Bacteroides graminisolvens]|uniref:hypothetical protein n=1 Tax=Bacteroides graminisolvens TaxID=477666 RepID=UPI003A8575F2
MISRSVLYFWLMRDYGLTDDDTRLLMSRLSDYELAKIYGLIPFRKGWFFRQ